VDEKEHRQVSQVSGSISVGRGNYIFGVICDNCPRRHKANKGGKNNHPRPLNCQNIDKITIKFTCTNPRIVYVRLHFCCDYLY